MSRFTFRMRSWGGPVSGAASARECWTRRDGVLLALMDGARVLGLGEATPLPGFSPEDLGSARQTLARLPELDELPPNLEEIARFTRADCPTPSARFAVECALVDALARRNGMPFHGVLADAPLASVPRTVLLGELADDALFARARQAVSRGARKLKLKTRASDPDSDAGRLLELRRAVGSEVELRLDLNGSLDVASARRALASYARAGVALVEEPTSGPALLELGTCALPWLADESLTDEALREALLCDAACAGFVLKPTRFGLLAALELARRAHDQGKQVVVTHAFEGPVALAATAELALAISSFARPVAGVDRHAALAAFPPASFPRIPEGAGPLMPTSFAGLGVGFDEDPWST